MEEFSDHAGNEADDDRPENAHGPSPSCAGRKRLGWNLVPKELARSYALERFGAASRFRFGPSCHVG